MQVLNSILGKLRSAVFFGGTTSDIEPDINSMEKRMELIRDFIKHVRSDSDYARVEALIENFIQRYYDPSGRAMEAAQDLFRELNTKWASVKVAFFTQHYQ